MKYFLLAYTRPIFLIDLGDHDSRPTEHPLYRTFCVFDLTPYSVDTIKLWFDDIREAYRNVSDIGNAVFALNMNSRRLELVSTEGLDFDSEAFTDNTEEVYSNFFWSDDINGLFAPMRFVAYETNRCPVEFQADDISEQLNKAAHDAVAAAYPHNREE